MWNKLPKVRKEAKGKTAYEHLKEHLKKLDIVVENEYADDESETKLDSENMSPEKGRNNDFS